MGFLSPPSTKVIQQAPQAPPVPPLAVQADLRPKKRPQTASFLGAESTPTQMASASGMGGKTLLGA